MNESFGSYISSLIIVYIQRIDRIVSESKDRIFSAMIVYFTCDPTIIKNSLKSPKLSQIRNFTQVRKAPRIEKTHRDRFLSSFLSRDLLRFLSADFFLS